MRITNVFSQVIMANRARRDTTEAKPEPDVLYSSEFRGLSVADSARKARQCTAVVDLETSLIRYQRARLSGLYVHGCDSVTVAAALLNGRSGDQ